MEPCLDHHQKMIVINPDLIRIMEPHIFQMGSIGNGCFHSIKGGHTNQYIGSMLDECSTAFKKPMFGLLCPNHSRL